MHAFPHVSLEHSPSGAPRKRVLLLVTLAETGGAQSYVRDLVDVLAPTFDVTVAAHGRGPLEAASRERGASYVALRHVRRSIGPRDVLALAEVWALCRRVRPHVLHANSSKAGILGRIAAAAAGVPIRIFTAHGWAFKATRGLPAAGYRFADRLMRPLTSAVICVSERERRAGIDAGVCNGAASVVIPNAVDVRSFEPRRVEPTTPLKVVAVGRLAEPKDFSTLLEAVARLERGLVELVLVGDGHLREPIVTLAERLGVAPFVSLRGTVTDVREVLAVADVLVLSSRSEGMPLSVIEAMAAGLPVVATDVGGLREVVVEGETGYLVPPGDAEALAGRIRLLARDHDLRERLGRQGRAVAIERFDVGRWGRRHLQLYQQLLERRLDVAA